MGPMGPGPGPLAMADKPSPKMATQLIFMHKWTPWDPSWVGDHSPGAQDATRKWIHIGTWAHIGTWTHPGWGTILYVLRMPPEKWNPKNEVTIQIEKTTFLLKNLHALRNPQLWSPIAHYH